MKCQNCQTEYNDTYVACPACAAPNPAYQAESASFTQAAARYPSAVELIKEVGKSKLLLIATILYTISCALSFITSDGLPVMEILITIGLWLFYSECKKPTVDPYVMKTTSLTMIKTVQTIEYVLCWIGAVATVISTAALICIPAQITSSILGFAEFMVFVIILLIVVTVSLAIEIILKKGIINYLKSAIESANTGLRPQKLPKYVPYLWIACSASSILVFGILIFIVEKMLDTLIAMMGSVFSATDVFVGALDEAALSEIAGLSFSLAILPNLIISLIPIVASVLFAKVLIDAKKLFDSAYYPTPEELFYQKQEYYNARAAAAAEYAANAWQYAQGYQQSQYGQPYQPYRQPYGQPTQNEQAQPPTDSENKDNT